MDTDNKKDFTQEDPVPAGEDQELMLAPGTSSQIWGIDKSKFLIPASILIAGVLVSASLFATSGSRARNTAVIGTSSGSENKIGGTVEIKTDGSYYIGNKDAEVAIVEFSDFQCPFCRSFWRNSLPLIKSEYIDTGKAMFVYKDFPLDFHPMANPSAQAARCAGEQDKYWQMHDKIFQEQEKGGQGTIQFSENDLRGWAEEIGLNRRDFNGCLDSGKYKTAVEQDYSEGVKAGVIGTPTVFINGRKIVGALPFATFKSVIDEELSK